MKTLLLAAASMLGVFASAHAAGPQTLPPTASASAVHLQEERKAQKDEPATVKAEKKSAKAAAKQAGQPGARPQHSPQQ
jgi:hypothetical protein